jgi:hypothetical protein
MPKYYVVRKVCEYLGISRSHEHKRIKAHVGCSYITMNVGNRCPQRILVVDEEQLAKWIKIKNWKTEFATDKLDLIMKNKHLSI